MEKLTARVWFRKEPDGDQDQLIAAHQGLVVARGYSIPDLNRALGKERKSWRLYFEAPIVTLNGPLNK